MTSINDDLRSDAGMRPLDRVVAIVTVLLVATLLILGWRVVVPSIDDLNQDNQLIDRGQAVSNCIGDRQDAIDKWRAVATFEFTHQVDRSTQGLPIDTTLAEQAEAAIYRLVDAKQDIRSQSRDLLADGDPTAEFECPGLSDDLVPPLINP